MDLKRMRELAGVVSNRPGISGVVESEEGLPTLKTVPKTYGENPEGFNTQLAKLMQQLKKDKGTGVDGIRQGYKGTGSKAYARQVWTKMPYHERGGPDVWLDKGFVKIGGIVDIPKDIPNVKKYGDESPEAVYQWILDTLKKVNAGVAAKYATGGLVSAKHESKSHDWADKPTAEVLRKTFRLDADVAKALADSLANAGSNKAADKAMEEANKALDGHGVEAIRNPDLWDNFWHDTAAIYVNMGDSYSSTILYNVAEEEFGVTSYGDFVEWLERSGVELP